MEFPLFFESKVSFYPIWVCQRNPAFCPHFGRIEKAANSCCLFRVPGTPLLIVRCRGKNFNSCQAMRACFVHGLPSHILEELYGLAVDPVRKELLIGSPGERRIMRFKVPSCYHIAHMGDKDDIGLRTLHSLARTHI